MLSGYGGRLIYLKGYRDGTPDLRINLLSSAIAHFGKTGLTYFPKMGMASDTAQANVKLQQ